MASWIQQSPDVDRVILFWELDDPEKIKERIASVVTSGEEFSVEMRECLDDLFDTVRDQPPVTFPELLQDYQAPSRAVSGGSNG